MLAQPDPSDWLHISRTYDQHRFSTLKQINRGNVAQLRMAWSRGLPAAGTQESTPLVYRGVVYLIGPGGSVQALDATNGDMLWEYRRDYPAGVQPRAARSKNLGIYEDMIYFGAPDGFLVAIDAQTGALRWETKVDEGQITAGGLLVADGKVISNRTCDQGKRQFCFIAAHDAKTGKEEWDADHNQERFLVRTRVNPDPRFVKWINPTVQRGTEQDIIITVAEGGGMFAVARQTGQFLWARPFPYGDPNANLRVVDVKTGQTAVNPDKLFKKDGDTIVGCYHNTRGLWQIAYDPDTNSVYVPFHDQCLSMEAVHSSPTGYGRRTGVMRPGSDPKAYMGVGKIDVPTG